MRQDIFLHFLNRDSREIFGLFRFHSSEQHYRLLRRALNVAVLLCEDRCIMPPGFVLEDQIAFDLAEAQAEFLEARLIQFPMRESSLGDYAEKKRIEYHPMRDRYSGLFSDSRLDFLGRHASGLIGRRSRMSEEIVRGWREGPDTNRRVWAPVKKLITPKEISGLGRIPSDLADDGSAVTWSAIEPRIEGAATRARGPLRNVLQFVYFKQYCLEFNLIALSRLPFISEEFFLPRRATSYNYQRFESFLREFDLAPLLLDAPASMVEALKRNSGYIAFADAYIQLAERSRTVTDMIFSAAEVRGRSTFDWTAFSKRHSALVNVPDEIELIELGDALGDAASIMTATYGLARRSGGVSSRAEQPTGPIRARTGDQVPNLIIFVALEEELRELAKSLQLKRAPGIPAATGELGGVPLAVLCPKDMGRVPAAVEVTRYLAERQGAPPTIILVVGLAGGFREEKVEPGHAICATRVVDLAHRKVIDIDGVAHNRFRRRDFDLDLKLRDIITSDEFDEKSWSDASIELFDWPKDRRPCIDSGIVASVDEVIASNEWLHDVRKYTEKLLGIEMEAGGVCAAAKAFNVPVSMLRVVSDAADPAKADDEWRRRGMRTLGELLKRLPVAEWLKLVAT